MSGPQKRILVIGAGFAGTWTAIAARRLLSLQPKAPPVEVAVVAPNEHLVIRPRLYEPKPADYAPSLTEVFKATDVRFIKGTVDSIDTTKQQVDVVDPKGARSSVLYDRLVLAAGSRLVRPKIPGLNEHAFNVDQLEGAVQLDAHLHDLAKLPSSAARNTAVVCGGGFTGIELATELPARMRAILGEDADIRVIMVDRNAELGHELGPGPRPIIADALKVSGVEVNLGSGVASIDEGGITTASGERIETLTPVWTAGMAANPLTQQIPGEKDRLGRLHVDANLRVSSVPNVFATGDTAYAATDDEGHWALMSCQHAIPMGRFSGHNVAADVLGLDLLPYVQIPYGTCLDLGAGGAVVSDGWDRKVMVSGAHGKRVKQYINGVVIYPPKPDAAVAFAAADPATEVPRFTMEQLNLL